MIYYLLSTTLPASSKYIGSSHVVSYLRHRDRNYSIQPAIYSSVSKVNYFTIITVRSPRTDVLVLALLLDCLLCAPRAPLLISYCF